MSERIERQWKNQKLQRTHKQRFAWMKKVEIELDFIANLPEVKSFSSEAINRIEYFRNRHVLVMPRIADDGQWLLDPFGKPKYRHLPPLLVAPLLLSDAEISPIAAYHVREAMEGAYGPENHAIFLGMEWLKETPRFVATVLLHEIGHAMQAEQEGRILIRLAKPRDKVKRFEEELKMWLFDCRLVGLMGGAELRGRVETTARNICLGWEKGEQFGIVVGPNSLLDLCYGSVHNERAVGLRTTRYMIFCELIALQMFHGPLAQIHQLALIERVHGSAYQVQDNAIKELHL